MNQHIPRYVKKMVRAYEVNKNLFKPGTVSIVNIYHDDGCEIFQGGECNCNFDMELEVKPKVRIEGK